MQQARVFSVRKQRCSCKRRPERLQTDFFAVLTRGRIFIYGRVLLPVGSHNISVHTVTSRRRG